MKFKTALFLAVLFCAFLPAVQPTDFEGKWRDADFNINLELKLDFTYGMQFPGGASNGRWAFQNGFLLLQDYQAGGAVVQYAVVGLQEDLLLLRDIQGVQMRFQRAVSRPKPERVPARTGQPLARSGEHSLYAGQVQAGIGLLQFIIGQALKPQETRELSAATVAEFQQEPVFVLGQLESLAGSLAQLRTLTDPVHIGIARQELFYALYQASSGQPEAQKPLLIKVMQNYIKVLAEDRQNKLLLTNRDLDGMVSYLAFLSEMSGNTRPFDQALRRQLADDLLKSFAGLPLEQKKLLCSAGLLWQVMDSNWRSLSPAQKQQFRAQFQPPAFTAAPPAAGSGSAAREMADFQARQRCMQMMMDMNTMSHATSLNIIENIGGTGNYWEVVDY